MLKVHDGRKKNEIRLCELENGQFFMWKDLVSRKVNQTVLFEGEIALDDPDGILTMLMPTGELVALCRDTWVEPIPDKQIYLEIED